MSNPVHDPATVWQQPPIVLNGTVPAGEDDPEPPMSALPEDGAAAVSAIPTGAARRSWMDSVFGQVADPSRLKAYLVIWSVAFVVAVAILLINGHWPALALSVFGLTRALVNVVRWRRSHP